ncbi:MAG: hypothetical protein K0Q66_1275 [Chitinophagaceae bacterium]|jgi:hypothetical protein|nr:hypothetical protein [Chitinophagaceae bacterium]
METRILKLILLIAFFLGGTMIAFCQGGGFGDDVDDVPLDGGLSLLIAAGVGYGAKKAHEMRKKKKEEEQGEK